MTEPLREVMTWDDLGSAARALGAQVAADGYQPGVILGIARGGLLPAGAVAYALGVKNAFTLSVEFYTGIEERMDVPLILPPVPDLIDVSDQKLLVVDDVADTGGTLEVVRRFCTGAVTDVRTAVLYEKPHSIVKCDYVWRRTDRWITFPWSADDPLEA